MCNTSLRRFFGGGGFPGFGGGFGGMGDEEESTPKGHDVHVELEVTLKDLYLGHQYKAGPNPLLQRLQPAAQAMQAN